MRRIGIWLLILGLTACDAGLPTTTNDPTRTTVTTVATSVAPAAPATSTPTSDHTSAPPPVTALADIVVDRDGEPRREIAPELLGTNVPAWLGPERFSSPEFLEAARASGATLIRMPGGSWSNSYRWAACELGGGGACGFDGAARPSDFASLLVATELPGMWTVSVNETAEGAAALVAFFNGDVDDVRPIGVDRFGVDWGTVADWAERRVAGGNEAPLGVRWWEIGNEVYGGRPDSGGAACAPFGWENSWTCEGDEYVLGDDDHDGYLALRAAMREIDPTIQVGVVGVEDAGSWGEWGREVVEAADGEIDFYIVHAYGFDGSPHPDAAVERPGELWPTLIENVRDLVGDIPIAVTEYNLVTFEAGDVERTMTTAVNALYLAGTIGELALGGVRVANQWNLANGVAATGTDYGLIHADTFEPAPQFHALEAWSRAASTIVPVTVEAPDLRAYATVDPGGRVVVIVLHTSGGTTAATMIVDGLEPSAVSVESWAADDPASTSMTVSMPDAAIDDDTITLLLPPWSINVVEVRP